MYVLTLVILLQGLGVALPASPPLGMTVQVVPLDSSQGSTVRAHFTAIVAGDCTVVTGLCADEEDCSVEHNTVAFTGTKPEGGWCAYHWQKTLEADFTGTMNLGTSTEMHVDLQASPVVRGNSGKLNNPAFVALLPPLRAYEKCPHHFHVSVRDLDGDKVRCRFAKESDGECVNCEPHTFLELDQGKCSITFNGDASAGLYHIYLMAEDSVPAPHTVEETQNEPMSAVPFILSLTVEEAEHSCSAEPVVIDPTPPEDKVFYILPFNQESFTVKFESNQESVEEIAVIGPPELYRTEFTVEEVASLSIAWVRSENELARLLPICFVANTLNLQSEPRCVWLHQREMKSLPDGTVLTCGNTEMKLVLPISSFTNINIADLQLNSPNNQDCPISFNATHLTATIPLEGCGTNAVHSHDELIYTNTLKTVFGSNQVIRREPILVLPLACRIPAVQAKGPQYEVIIPEDTEEVFGRFVKFSLDFHFPGSGPKGSFTKKAVFRTDNRRHRREIRTEENTSLVPGSRINVLDLYVYSNCSVGRVETLVSSCLQSETEDFKLAEVLLEGGCIANTSASEVVTDDAKIRVFRLDLSNVSPAALTMFVQCNVSLCITTLPSQSCPDLCTSKISRTALDNSVYSKTYTVKSDPVSLVVTTPAPTTTTAAKPTITTTTGAPTAATTTTTPATTVTTTAAPSNTTSHAPEKAPLKVMEVMMAVACLFLQPFLY